MDALSGMLNVSTFQMADFPDSETGRKHKTEDSLKFDVSDGKEKSLHLLSGRDKRNKGIEFPERQLIRIPHFMQDINVKKSKL